MKKAVILDTGSFLDNMHPLVKIFAESDKENMDSYIEKMVKAGNKCHIFDYKETKHLTTILSTTTE